jgi:hypothetical protein
MQARPRELWANSFKPKLESNAKIRRPCIQFVFIDDGYTYRLKPLLRSMHMEEKMNKLFLGVWVLVTVLLSQHALADSRHGRHGYNDSRFGGSHFRSYNRDYNRSHNRSHNRDFARRGNRNYSRGFANPYHYGRAGIRRNDFFSFSYGNRFNDGFSHRYNNDFNDGFYNNGHRNRWGRNRNRNNVNIIGALALGSLLSRQSYPARSIETVTYRSAPVRDAVRKRDVVYVNSTARASVSATPKRRLLRDLQGDCYKIEISPNGDERRSQIDSAACNF